MNSEKRKLILIHASTGCSCCSNENHYRGPYKSREEAERRIQQYYAKDSKFWPLASQYAPRGHYKVEEHTIEILPDRRVIWISTVYADEELPIYNHVYVFENGISCTDEQEYFYGDG